ncbi:MAG: hypothetical protein MJ239_03015 [Bacilli bacterium]|nr:hypothetical protein [Bacilli bacterium]
MNKKSLLVLAVSGLLTIGMASCGGQQGGSSATILPSGDTSATSTPSTETKPVSKIAKETMPKFRVGEQINLDDYVKVVYVDKTEDHNYTITNTDDDLWVQGHTLTAATVKQFTVTVKAGTKSSRVTIDVRSEDNIELAEFLAPLALTPQNYVLNTYEFTETGGIAYDGLTAIHNENYFAEFNANDLSDENIILEKLSNGKAYWGEFQADGTPVFEPGATDFDGYYITGDLVLDGYDFVSTFEEDEEGEVVESLVAPASAANALLNYGLSNFPENYGYTVVELDYLGAFLDEDGNAVEQLFMPIVSKGTQMGYWTIVGITAIGESNIDILDEAHVDPSYLPITIEAPEIVTGFETVQSGKNYTLTYQMYASDDEGNLATGEDATGSLFAAMFGCVSLTSVVTLDSQGISGYFEQDGEVAGNIDYFNYNGQAYGVDYTDETPVTKPMSGISDVFTVDEVKAWTLAVNAADVNNTEWVAKETVSGKTTVAGKCGDNKGSERGNMFFEAVFNPIRWFYFGSDTVAAYFTEAQEFSAGNYHALTLSSDWAEVSYDGTTLVAKAIVYLPFTDDGNKYCTWIMTVDEVGTTANDFSAFYPVVE